GIYRGEDFLDDDGSSDEPVRVNLAITVSPEKLVLDFDGSSPQRPGNINAVAPMTYSASFFAIKVLTDPEIPVNAGTFRNVELRIPEGSFLAARPPAAVCAGNTETTQRIADTVLKVCAQVAPDRVPAASQGSMNTRACHCNASAAASPPTGCMAAPTAHPAIITSCSRTARFAKNRERRACRSPPTRSSSSKPQAAVAGVARNAAAACAVRRVKCRRGSSVFD